MTHEKDNNVARKLNLKKKILFSFLAVFLSLFIVELGVRIYLATKQGPGILLHGIVSTHKKQKTKISTRTRGFYEEFIGNYWKYSPNQIKYDEDKTTGEMFKITINNNGFRGADFNDEKKAEVIRVVTLGASSTFGYGNRDNETYPYLMQQVLDSRCKGAKSFEVINLAIPHFKSEQILAVFFEEALKLKPDVITFYEGINDSSDTKRLRRKLRMISPLRKIVIPLYQRLLSLRFAYALITPNTKTFTKKEINNFVQGKQDKSSGKSERFMKNVSMIYEECKKRGITFIIANQQAQSLMVPKQNLKGTTYHEEVEMIKNKFSKQSSLKPPEMYLYVHSIIMKDLEMWALSNDVTFVNIIEKLDQDRDVLTSWVHLNMRGNQIVAEMFSEKILEQRCQDNIVM